METLPLCSSLVVGRQLIGQEELSIERDKGIYNIFTESEFVWAQGQ